MFCDRDAARAEAMARPHVIGYFASVLTHYEMLDEQFGKAKGYEAYATAREMMKAAGKEASAETFLEAQAWGTPQQILDRLEHRREILGDFEMNLCVSYAGMRYEDIEPSVRLFTKEVLPEIRTWRMGETSDAASSRSESFAESAAK
jgi:hypothetical protein